MRLRQRIALGAGMALSALMPLAIVAAGSTPTPAPNLGVSAGSYYVTQRSAQGIARVTVNPNGSVTVENNYIRGLPGGGPDSAVFASSGNMLTSNTDDRSISEIDTSTRRIVRKQVNAVPINGVADLALDPRGNDVWAIGWSASDSMAIVRVTLDSGTVTGKNPDSVSSLGGIAFDDDGDRVFVSSHAGRIVELDPATGHVVRDLKVSGAPDGLTVDPSTGHLFATHCAGICEFDVGSDGSPKLALTKTHATIDGDGIAADGQGHVYVANSACASLCRLDLADEAIVSIAKDIPSADDIIPVAGNGAGLSSCLVLSGCFTDAGKAGIAAASVALILFLGFAGLSWARSPAALAAVPAPAHSGVPEPPPPLPSHAPVYAGAGAGPPPPHGPGYGLHDSAAVSPPPPPAPPPVHDPVHALTGHAHGHLGAGHAITAPSSADPRGESGLVGEAGEHGLEPSSLQEEAAHNLLEVAPAGTEGAAAARELEASPAEGTQGGSLGASRAGRDQRRDPGPPAG